MNQQYQDIPFASSENMILYTSERYSVIKAHKNNKKFDEALNYAITDRSIGICFDINSELTENATDEEIRQSSTYLNQERRSGSRKMVSDFLRNIRIGDKVIIGKGSQNSLFVCTIDSTPYYVERENTRLRRRIKDIERVPENFERNYLRKTIQVYN